MLKEGPVHRMLALSLSLANGDKFLIGQLFNGIFELCATDLCNRQLSFQNEMYYERQKVKRTLSVCAAKRLQNVYISIHFSSVHLTKC